MEIRSCVEAIEILTRYSGLTQEGLRILSSSFMRSALHGSTDEQIKELANSLYWETKLDYSIIDDEIQEHFVLFDILEPSQQSWDCAFRCGDTVDIVVSSRQESDEIHTEYYQVWLDVYADRYKEITPKHRPYFCGDCWKEIMLLSDQAQGHTEPPGVHKKAMQYNPASGFVYLLQSPTGFYKIGRTRSPQDRMKTFSVKLPFEVDFIAIIKTSDMKTLEAELHERFTNKRGNGEWFALSEDDVAYIKSLAGSEMK